MPVVVRRDEVATRAVLVGHLRFAARASVGEPEGHNDHVVEQRRTCHDWHGVASPNCAGVTFFAIASVSLHARSRFSVAMRCSFATRGEARLPRLGPPLDRAGGDVRAQFLDEIAPQLLAPGRARVADRPRRRRTRRCHVDGAGSRRRAPGARVRVDLARRARHARAIRSDPRATTGVRRAGYLVTESLYRDYGDNEHAPTRDWPDGAALARHHRRSRSSTSRPVSTTRRSTATGTATSRRCRSGCSRAPATCATPSCAR